jgi:hypothetical protein
MSFKGYCIGIQFVQKGCLTEEIYIIEGFLWRECKVKKNSMSLMS